MTVDLRSLDAVDAPDQWDDIVARAADPGPDLADAPPAATSSPRRALLLAAAVVLVVAAIAGALVIRGGGGADPAADPTAIWGHRWQLTGIDVSGGAVTEQLRTARGEPVVLDATREGRIVTEVCNRFTAEPQLAGDQLRFDDPADPAIHCPDGLEDLVANLFTTSATVEVDGTRLVLRTPGAPVHRIGEPPPDPVLPPQTTYTFIRSDAAPQTYPTHPWPGAFFGHRWAMVQALDDGVRLAQPADYVIEAGSDPDRFEAPGCDVVHGPASLDANGYLTVAVAEPSPIADCYFGMQVNWDVWFRELLADRPQVSVDGQRALIVSRGKQVLLVRLD